MNSLTKWALPEKVLKHSEQNTRSTLFCLEIAVTIESAGEKGRHPRDLQYPGKAGRHVFTMERFSGCESFLQPGNRHPSITKTRLCLPVSAEDFLL